VTLARIRLRDGLRDRREYVQEYADMLDALFIQRGIEGDRLVATVDLYQALGGGYDAGPDAFAPKPAPEDDPLTPVVDVVQKLGGG
jgi:outer membrane protein TolC